MSVVNTAAEIEDHSVVQAREKAIICSVKAWLPTQRMVVGVIGGSTFYSSCSPSICRYLGEALWKCGITLATAGTLGIPEMVAWSYTFFGQHHALKNAFHFVKCNNKNAGDCIERSDIGLVVAAGKSEEEHVRIFAKLCPVYILLEGGPRASYLAKKALDNDSIVIPVGRTGGAASGLFNVPDFPKPDSVPADYWWALSDDSIDVRHTVGYILSILHKIYRSRASV